MDKPQTVICFAANIHGNDSLLLLQAGGEGDFVLTKHIELHPTLRGNTFGRIYVFKYNTGMCVCVCVYVLYEGYWH